ncbi:MAG: glycine-rich protein [Bacteroidia bacterium]|nr:glycine-rich protein [Bacteroidia bacterium]
MKKRVIYFFLGYLLFVGLTQYIQSQNIGINANATPPDNSAMLDIDVSALPTNGKKGLLIPRMTTAERNALPSPANSLLIYNTTTRCFEFWDVPSSSWQTLGCACSPPSSAPTANAASGITSTGFTANWSSVSGATCYQLDVATDVGFTSFVPGFNNLNVGNVTSYNVTGLSCGTTYYYRIRACNSCGNTGNSNVINVTTGGCCTSFPNSITFNYTGNNQTWTVPPGVTCVSVDVRGASGGNTSGPYPMTGGKGARITGTLAVTSGQILQINVGGQGQSVNQTGACGSSGGLGGWNGGGNGGMGDWNAAGGGGASDIRTTPYALSNRIIVAGGGGGGAVGCGCSTFAGDGGCNNGLTGSSSSCCGGTAGGPGGGGTQTSGGIGGGAGSGGVAGGNGSLGIGGNGASGTTCDDSGGGGGGGYYGGGGGGSSSNWWSGGGGGGSSLIPPGCSCTAGFQTGNGLIIIYY